MKQRTANRRHCGGHLIMSMLLFAEPRTRRSAIRSPTERWSRQRHNAKLRGIQFTNTTWFPTQDSLLRRHQGGRRQRRRVVLSGVAGRAKHRDRASATNQPVQDQQAICVLENHDTTASRAEGSVSLDKAVNTDQNTERADRPGELVIPTSKRAVRQRTQDPNWTRATSRRSSALRSARFPAHDDHGGPRRTGQGPGLHHARTPPRACSPPKPTGQHIFRIHMTTGFDKRGRGSRLHQLVTSTAWRDASASSVTCTRRQPARTAISRHQAAGIGKTWPA